MVSLEEIQKPRVEFEVYLKNLAEKLTIFLNKNLPSGKFFILDSRSSWHIISSKALTGFTFNMLYLDEFFPNKVFREYRIVVIVNHDRNKEEFEFKVNKKKPY